MHTTITLDELAFVTGGGTSTTEVTTPVGGYRSTRSDYGTCVDTVRREVGRQYPDSRPWYQFWGTDQNAGPRTRATLDGMRGTCGLPPS